jgi:hypothetical protein
LTNDFSLNYSYNLSITWESEQLIRICNENGLDRANLDLNLLNDGRRPVQLVPRIQLSGPDISKELSFFF